MRPLILFLFLPTLVFSQEFQFQQEWDTIPVLVEGDTLPAAWRGGYSSSSPFLVDIDGDDDFDIVMGQGGFAQMDFWQNTGSAQQENYHIYLFGLQGIDNGAYTSPEFVDMDSDSDLDLILSAVIDGGSRMLVYFNVGSSTLPNFQISEDTLKDTQGNIIYGTRHDLADIDGDGDYDLFVGEWYTGRIHFYRNVGNTTNYSFQLVDNYFAGVQTGYWSSPEFCDIDGDGDLDMFVGDDSGGHIWFYRNNGTPQQYNFTLVSNNWLNISVGEKADPQFCDIDDDGDYDLLIGKDNDIQSQPRGDVHFWRNIGTSQSAEFVLEHEMYLTLDFGKNSELGLIDVNLDGIMDLFVNSDNLYWLKNTGTQSNPCFKLQEEEVIGPGVGTQCSFGYGNLNGDGYTDMAWFWSGHVEFWINSGDTSNPVFYYDDSIRIGIPTGRPFLADMDGDDDDDLILGLSNYHEGNFIYFYENQGSAQQYNFIRTSTNYQGWSGEYFIDAILDADNDGDNDIFAYLATNLSLQYFENIGTMQQAIFTNPISVTVPGYYLNSIGISFSDIDNDGDLDGLNGSYGGGLFFFRNITGQSPIHPDPKHPAPTHPVITLLPNPGNSSIAARYELRAASNVSLKVFDISGRLTGTLFYGFQLPGTYTSTWDASHKASGVYILKLEIPNQNISQKITILR